jgi:NAD(P)-dependent dehydrogenase (short-subunit alcohol dehydrogenase family)
MAEPWSVRGRVCVVTGSSWGIGREVARGLARQGARVVMLSRTKERGEAARADVVATTGSQTVDLLVANLSVQAEVRRVAREIDERYGQLQVLVNNAGGVFRRLPVTPDGLEYTFALNHLGYFLLTNLLLPKLKTSAPSRVVCVASEAHWGARWDWENLQGERHYHQLEAYCNSKLANILFTNELARRLEGTGVTANAAHPGFVRSGFGRTASLSLRIGVLVAWPCGISAQKGAQTPLWAATAPELAGVTGKYFARCAEARSSQEAHDAAMAARLWLVSEKLTGFVAAA